jgi:hypothetical protein
MAYRQDAILTAEDLTFIEKILYKVKREELVARQIAYVNTSDYDPWAQVIAYEWYDAITSAKIIAAGGSAKDIPVVGEKGGKESQKVYTLANKIAYTREELEAHAARARMGHGAVINLPSLRIEVARRGHAEKENQLFFVGDSTHKMKGVFNHTGVYKEDAAATGSGAGDDRILWSNKTPAQIYSDLLTARKYIRQKNIFTPKVLVLSPGHYDTLLAPYSDLASMTVLEWIQSKGLKIDKIVQTTACESANHSLGSNVFMMLDNDREILELATPRDMEIGPPVYDILQGSEQAVTQRIGGLVLRHPSAVYIGKKI